MQFWRLTDPDYDSDYRHSYINGSLEHPYGLPGVRCHVCQSTYGGSRILPQEPPTSLRAHQHLTERWPIPLEHHLALQQEVRQAFEREGVALPELRAGDDFQPCYLEVPSRPRADFLWSSLGSVVVSDRIRTLLQSLGVADVSFSPVILRRVGSREANVRTVPVPESGEPEDIIDHVPLLARTDSVGPYFELTIQAVSGYHPEAPPTSVCSGCGRETFPRATPVSTWSNPCGREPMYSS